MPSRAEQFLLCKTLKAIPNFLFHKYLDQLGVMFTWLCSLSINTQITFYLAKKKNSRNQSHSIPTSFSASGL